MWPNSSELLKEKVQNLEPLPLPQFLVTTGFPAEELILTTQEVKANGLDIVKLGMPSSAAITDRTPIHNPSNITFQGNIFSERLLGLLRLFRNQGLKALILLLGLVAQRIEAYCREENLKGGLATINLRSAPPIWSGRLALPSVERPLNPTGARGRFGDFGGRYVPEPLVDCLAVLEATHKSAMADPEFHKELQSHFGYINRPSQMYLAQNLTDEAGGAKIWFKREDLNHTGSHHINNAIGQILLARRLGKTRIIAETGSGQHGVATATVCAKFGMECVVYMGSEDVRRQSLNVLKMEMLGTKVIPVTSGSRRLKDAINEAFRDLVTNLSDTYYLIGSAIGPHPFPTIVRDFQNIIGQEIKTQMNATRGKLPDAVVACVGGGSNAIGAFYEFINDESVRLIGVEAGGEGRHTNVSDPRTSGASASLAIGRPGVFHGMKTYVIQSETGQIIDTHSIAAGLDYPAVGPEHVWLKDSGRAEYVVATDEEALQGFRMLTRREGIIPALESSHAIWYAVQLAKNLDRDKDIVVCLSGSGDKDVEHIATMSFK